MEEPSIEEKARRYDEAIVKGRQIQNTPYTAYWDTMKEVVEHLFPELKESEDERIRKEIIYHIQNCDDTIDEETEKRMIAWLEKQGSQILANSAKTCKVEQNLAWSEEDKKRFESTLHRMEIVGNGCAFGQLKDDIEWLKSLKERYTWKPSESDIN